MTTSPHHHQHHRLGTTLKSSVQHKYPTYSKHYGDKKWDDNGRVISTRPATTKSAPGLFNHQVDELQNSLHETDQAMTENEQMLSDYRRANRRQSMEMDEIRSELNKSRELLATSRCQTPVPQSSRALSQCSAVHSEACNYDPEKCNHHDKRCTHSKELVSELEREKLARERAEFNSVKMVSLLDTSLRNHTEANEGIREEVNELRQNVSDSQKKLETSNEMYEQKIKEVDYKLRETSQLNRTEGAFEELTQQVTELKNDLWQREASEKRRKMLQQIKVLENDLCAERQRRSMSVRQSQKLHTQIKVLGSELGEVKQEKEKALTCLEATSRYLNKSLGGREELLQKIEELHQALSSSESQRIAFVEKCGQLSQECFKQEVCQEALRDRAREIESKMDSYESERLSLKDSQHVLTQELSEKTLSESRLLDHCEILQSRHVELERLLETKEEELVSLLRKFEYVNRGWNDEKLEMVQLRADLKSFEDQNSSLTHKVQSSENVIQQLSTECERLSSDLKKTTDQLTKSEKRRKSSYSQLEQEKKRIKQCIIEKDKVQSQISELKQQLDESKEKQATSYTQSLQAIKKFKVLYRQLEHEKTSIEEEKENISSHVGELEKQIKECQNILRDDQCKFAQAGKENSELKMKLSSLGNQSDELRSKNDEHHHHIIDLESTLTEERNNLEKCRYELSQWQHDSEGLKHEVTSLQQSLEQTTQQYQITEKRLGAELTHVKELSDSQILQLQNELESQKNEKIKLVAKYRKQVNTHQSMKNEFHTQELQCRLIDEEKKKLESKLEELQRIIHSKEQELLDKTNEWKESHFQEVDILERKHAQITNEMKLTISTLEHRLADYQGMLSEIKKQQLMFLDDQQKIYAEDLKKSLEDTERVRRKYLRAKKTYEDKEASLEEEINTFTGEYESLRKKLSQSQMSLLQQVEEHESILRAAAKEVDTIVHQMGIRVDIPMFPIVVGDETDIKKWMADMLAKLKWLQKEITDLLSEESKLRSKLQLKQKVCFDTSNSS